MAYIITYNILIKHKVMALQIQMLNVLHPTVKLILFLSKNEDF